MYNKIILPVIFILVATFAGGQSHTTEIWTTDITIKDGKVSASAPVRITQNEYYDNQPSFSPDGMLLWFAAMPDTIQSDIYEYNFKKKEIRQVTNTPESEYQPQQIPFNKKKISVVRVDEDKAQRFYEVNLDGSEFSLLMPNEDSVAYYTWMNDTTVGAYMLDGQGGILQQFDMIPQQAIILMNGGFGRCLARIPGSDDLSYVQKSSNGKWMIMKYEMATEDRTPICETLPGSEDYCFSPDGKIFMGSGSKLYYFDTKAESGEWIEIADFVKTAGTFYRLAISPKGDKIALVSYKGEKP